MLTLKHISILEKHLKNLIYISNHQIFKIPLIIIIHIDIKFSLNYQMCIEDLKGFFYYLR